MLPEVHLVELTDDDLITRVGKLFETIKRLEESKKSDSVLLRMKNDVKTYEDKHYGSQIRDLRTDLTVCRRHLKTRNIIVELDGHAYPRVDPKTW